MPALVLSVKSGVFLTRSRYLAKSCSFFVYNACFDNHILLIIRYLKQFLELCILNGYNDFLPLKDSVVNFAEKLYNKKHMATQKTLGKLIEDEVRRQQMNITDFAEKIFCTRANAYKIFDKSSIQVDQLARISKVLNRNFFAEIARDPSLIDIDSEAAIQEMENRRAVSQFMEIVPNLVYKMGEEPIIAFGRPSGMEENVDLPDFMLTNYGIIFTLGAFLSEKYLSNPMFNIEVFENEDGIKVYSMINTFKGTRMIDVKLDYKTEEEWEKTLRFIFETFF